MAFRFNDVEGVVNCGSDSDIDNVWDGDGGTLSVWLHLDSYGEGNFGRIVSKAPEIGSDGWAFFSDADSPGKVRFLAYGSTNGNWETASDSILTGQWYHVCLMWDSTSVDPPVIFLDGVDVTVTELSPVTALADDSGYDLRIGNRGNESRTFDGRIADLRLYDRLLSGEEAEEIYAARGKDAIVDDLLRRFPLGPQPKGQSPNTAFIGSAATSVTEANVIATDMPSHQEGDLLVMMVFGGGNDGTAPTFTTPAGWTSRQHIGLPSTATTGAFEVWTRVASSGEPATYDVFANEAMPLVSHIAAYRGPEDSVSAVGTDTGTSATPSSPTITPSANSLVMRIMAFDDDTQVIDPTVGMFPSNVRGRYLATASSGTSNGGGIMFGEEGWDDTATGARAWAIAASDQWAGISIAFPWGGGQGGLPCKDLSDAQAHGETVGGVLSDEDLLTIKG